MTEIHPGSQGRPLGHGNGGFEREDLGAKPIVAFIVTVVVLGVVIYFGIWGMFHVLDKQLAKDDQSRSPLIQVQTDTRTIQDQQIKAFPEPRLEDNERTEINDTRYAEDERLNSAGRASPARHGGTALDPTPIARPIARADARGRGSVGSPGRSIS